MVSFESHENVWEKILLLVVTIAFLKEMLVATFYVVHMYSAEIQLFKSIVNIDIFIIIFILAAIIYSMVGAFLRDFTAHSSLFKETIKGELKYLTKDEEDNNIKNIVKYIKKLVHEFDETSNKVLEFRNFLDLIANASNDAIFIVDEMGSIEYGNKKFFNLSGFTEDEISNMHISSLFTLCKECSILLNQNYSKTWDQKQLDTDLIMKSGLRKHVTIKFEYAELNSRKKLVCVIKDISVIQKIDEIRNNIVSNISHELRTPLTIVKGFIEMASEEDNIEKRKIYLQKSLEALKRQEWTIEDLLEVAMNSDDTKSISFDCVHLYDLVEKAIEKILPKAMETDINIKNFVERGICVKADPDKLCYAVAKLLDNAVKFNKPGKDVVIESVCAADRIIVKVMDNGIGIPPEYLRLIFDQFYQIDPSFERRYNGNGLGLTIAKRIIELHGGSIWVESETNKGSTFLFTLDRFSSSTSSY